MISSAATLDYLEYQTIPRIDLIRDRKKEVLPKNSTTNEYLDISKKKFITHLQKLSDIASKKELWPELAEKPSTNAIFLANIIIQQLQKDELVPAKIVASAEGGVAFCFVDQDKYADIECLNSGEILGVTTNRRDRPSVWEIKQNQSEIARATERIREFISKKKT